ncbi:NEAT domain-containing protein [Paenibacillus yanchengensis]|uniref:NEAT domain-containing protein n=1 Tax=Paenibacillus yanchengensis TaxID=2035833 RepID=A0ABW4YPL5_9BACL
MNRKLKYMITMLLTLFIALPVVQAQAAGYKIPAGEYDITIEVLQDKKDETSATAQYIETAAKLVVEEKGTFVVATLKNSAWWKSFETQTVQPGTFADKNFKAVEVVSEDTKKDTRVVKFAVADYMQPLNAKIHIVVTGVPGLGEYDKSYDIRLKFGRDSNAGSGSNTSEENKETNKDKEEATKPETTALTDGEYTINFKALHEKEEKDSSMGRYMKTPAKLTVKEGKHTVVVSLTDNEQIKQFQVEQGKELVDSKVVSVDEAANTRDISFEVEDLSAIVNAKVQIFVAAQNYTGNHNIRLSFDVASAKKATTEEANEVNFQDIEKSWAKQYITSLAERGMIKGTSDTTFGPSDSITRAQFTVLLARALDLPTEAYKGTFADVTEKMDWAVAEVEAANKAGIVAGDKGKFNPNSKINRQDMVTMLVRALEYADKKLVEVEVKELDFADQADIASYAQKNVQIAVQLELVNGTEVAGKTYFAPQDTADRAQAAKMIYLLVEAIK